MSNEKEIYKRKMKKKKGVKYNDTIMMSYVQYIFMLFIEVKPTWSGTIDTHIQGNKEGENSTTSTSATDFCKEKAITQILTK